MRPSPVIVQSAPLTDDSSGSIGQLDGAPPRYGRRQIIEFFSKVFDGIKVHPDLVLAQEQRIGWAFRKGSPQLAVPPPVIAETARAR